MVSKLLELKNNLNRNPNPKLTLIETTYLALIEANDWSKVDETFRLFLNCIN